MRVQAGRLLAIVLTAFLHLMPDSLVQAFPNFREAIPNGERVMSPCIPLFKVPGVGHVNPFGGGPRNAFGKAFEDAGLQWTTDLCQADSDGDGMTNGAELGDPDCTWSPGETPDRRGRITHPGYNNFSPGCIRRLIDFIIRRRPRPPRPPRSTTPAFD